MQTIALCCDDADSCETIKRQLFALCSAPVVSYVSGTAFLSAVTEHPDWLMMIAQAGVGSIGTAMAAADHNPFGKLVWFCDLDLALLSFRFKAVYFGLMPVTMQALETALSYCGVALKPKDG